LYRKLCKKGGYYGARYEVYPERRIGDPKISVWLSVDPLAHKYPHVTPYNFVENNPLRLVDPTGMGPEDSEKKLIDICKYGNFWHR